MSQPIPMSVRFLALAGKGFVHMIGSMLRNKVLTPSLLPLGLLATVCLVVALRPDAVAEPEIADPAMPEAAMMQRKVDQLTETVRDDGSVDVILPRTYRSVSAVRINANGEREMECFNDVTRLRNFLDGAAPAFKAPLTSK